MQFPWDREGQFDEHSSCWIRVAQLSGGNDIGSQYIPQIGDEVGVMFVDGNPDRPIIVSSRYHRQSPEPYGAQTHPHVSAITTHTQGSASINAHELHIHAGGTTMVMDGSGIKVTTGGSVTSHAAPTTAGGVVTQVTGAAVDSVQGQVGDSSDKAKTDSADSSTLSAENLAQDLYNFTYQGAFYLTPI